MTSSHMSTNAVWNTLDPSPRIPRVMAFKAAIFLQNKNLDTPSSKAEKGGGGASVLCERCVLQTQTLKVVMPVNTCAN